MLGIGSEYSAFDIDILTHINSVFSTLNQLGIGPLDGFEIEDSTSTWNDYINGNPQFNPVKTYMYLRVRMLFDPPITSFLIDAFNKQKDELEWRLNVVAETAPETLPDGDFWFATTESDPIPLDAEDGDVAFDPITGDVWRIRE